MGWLDPHLYLLDTQRRGDLPRRAVISNKSIEHVMLSRRPEMTLGIFVFCNCAMSCICLYALLHLVDPEGWRNGENAYGWGQSEWPSEMPQLEPSNCRFMPSTVLGCWHWPRQPAKCPHLGRVTPISMPAVCRTYNRFFIALHRLPTCNGYSVVRTEYSC